MTPTSEVLEDADVVVTVGTFVRDGNVSRRRTWDSPASVPLAEGATREVTLRARWEHRFRTADGTAGPTIGGELTCPRVELVRQGDEVEVRDRGSCFEGDDRPLPGPGPVGVTVALVGAALPALRRD